MESNSVCNHTSDNKIGRPRKLSDNNLASELGENKEFFKPITIEEIVIFMIKMVIGKSEPHCFLFHLTINSFDSVLMNIIWIQQLKIRTLQRC